MNNNIAKVLNEVKLVVHGKDEVLRKIIVAGTSFLSCGKATIALSFNKVLNPAYKSIQFTNDLMSRDILGYEMYEKNTGTMCLVKGSSLRNIFFDEYDIDLNNGSAFYLMQDI